MTSTITDVGTALSTFVGNIDITSIYSENWAHKFNRPFEPEEVTDGGYPTLMIVPAEDESSTLDSRTDSDRIVYWVTLLESMSDTINTGESSIRALADLVRNELRDERTKPNPLGSDNYDLQLSGTWGWDIDRGERFYRLIVTVNVAQTLT